MKKIIFLFSLLFLQLNITFAQDDCRETLNRKFGNTISTPVLLNVLGTSPQFGEIPNHTAYSAMTHLKSIYNKKVKNSHTELDELFNLLGYTGFKDPSFTIDRITPEFLEAGTVGYMGRYSKGHKYTYSSLGKRFPAYKIWARSGDCFVFIMKKCGNVFYIPSLIPYKFIPPPAPPVKPEPAVVCVTQNVNISGVGKLESSDVFNTKETTSIYGNFNGKSVNLGSYTIAVRTMYDYVVNASAQSKKSYQVAKVGNETISDVTMNLPISLGFNIAQQKAKLGNDGKMIINLDEKSFQAFSKAFKAEAVNRAAVSDSEFDAYTKKEETSKSIATGSAKVISSTSKATRQTIDFGGNSMIKDGSVKSSEQMVRILGVHRKTGKLALGETAEKYLCLGSFSVPVKQGLQYDINGKMLAATTLDVCDKTTGKVTETNVDVPIKMDYKVTKEDIMIGDGNTVVITLTEDQYKSLSKNYSRCCGIKNCDK